MAFSSSRNYTESVTAANIIALAHRRLGILDPDESIDSTEEANSLVTLNLILKEWVNEGADVWIRNTGHLFLPDPGTVSKYTFGTSGSGLFTSQYYVTTLASAASASATTITVTDDTNMSDTDRILVENDDGTLSDTTISGAPSANSVTLTAGLDDSAAAGNIVYSWPTSDDVDSRVIDLRFAQRRITNTDNAATDAGYMEGIDTPIRIIGEEEYQTLPTKLQTGTPVSVYLRVETINPELHIWPTGGEGNVHSLVLEYITDLQDLDGTTNNIDLPPGGFNPLAWQLAWEMAPEYGLSIAEMRELERKAIPKMEKFMDFQVERSDVGFEIGYR